MSGCQYFIYCVNNADGNIQHPVLGKVATCQTCADEFGLTLLFDPENPNPDLLPDPIDGWHDDHTNLVTLVSYLVDQGYNGSDLLHVVEKPWHYQDEFKLACYELEHAS